MACSIETLLDLDTLSVEELIGRLNAADERYEQDAPEAKHAGKLLLSEEEWFARMNLRDGGASSSHAGRVGGSKPRGRRRGKGNPRAQGRSEDRDKCRYCGIAGHWARDCDKKQREEAYLVQGGGDDDGGALLTTQVCTIPVPSTPQLTVPAGPRAQPGATVPAASTLPVAETSSRPVAEGEVQPAPT